MSTPANLQKRITDFLIVHPTLQLINERRALVHLASLDDDLMSQIDFSGPVLTFLPPFLETLMTYGHLSDGRDALEAFLQAIKQTLGENGQATIDALINEWKFYAKEKGISPQNLDAYLRYIIHAWETIESPLLPPDVSLSHIAAHVKIVNTGSSSILNKAIRLIGYRKKNVKDFPSKNAELGQILEDNSSTERWVVLGDPGTGKTTLLLYEACRLAQTALNQPGSMVPAWVSLANFNVRLSTNFDYSIYDYFESTGHSLALTNLGQQFHKLSKNGRVVFLLDGLDEVPDAARKSLCTRIHASIPASVGNRIVYTSRKVGFTALTDFVILEVEPLSIEEQRRIMLAICGEQKTATLLRNIAGRRDLQDMASVPMALTVLALVARENDNLNDFLHYHTDLFKFGARILLEGRHRGGIGVLNPENAEMILARASFKIHSNLEDSPSDETFSAEKVEDAVLAADTIWLSPWQGPRHFIEDVASHSNIIYSIDTLKRRYRYIHRTFREYFAAVELAKLNSTDRQKRVRDFIHQQQWAEVLVLLGGLIADREIENYLYQLLSGSSDLALRTLKEVKRLNPQLAAEVLQLKPGNLRDRRQVFTTLAQKLRSPDQTIDVFRAYIEAAKADIPRADLYFIQEVLRGYNLDIAKDLLKELFKYLPKAPHTDLVDSVTIQGEILPYFCNVPAGSFLLGGAENDPERPNWVSAFIDINVSAFRIGRVPVTNAVYEVFDPSHKEMRDFQDEVYPEELDHHPVVLVSWYEAEIFCQWLAQAVPGIRLPTEAEWEKAASWSLDGKKMHFPWGENWDPSLLNCWQSGPNRTTRVGSYPGGVSPYGVLDMAGNVWEWCSDWFDDNIQSYIAMLKQFPKDPKGPNIGVRRVDRGGGWYHDVGLPCTFLRAADDPADIFSHCGFRIVQSFTSS